MTIYRVDENGEASVKPIVTTFDFAELMNVHPVDLEELEQDFMTLDQEPVDVIHHFYPGIYMREARLPKGCFLIGHKQAKPHLNLMLNGYVGFLGGGEAKGPFMAVGEPGRKCGVIHEETAWYNIYATDETDIGTLESMFLEKSDAAIAQEIELAQAETDETVAARADYLSMLLDLDVTHEMVSAMSAYKDDRINLPWGAYKFRSAPSPIHGNGVFASARIEAGETIGPANINGKRTVLGYGINHSANPNAYAVATHGGISVVAKRDITGNRAGVFGEEITMDYRQSRKVALCLR